jgi:hypothetical protein
MEAADEAFGGLAGDAGTSVMSYARGFKPVEINPSDVDDDRMSDDDWMSVLLFFLVVFVFSFSRCVEMC